jgi:hypothetical protein
MSEHIKDMLNHLKREWLNMPNYKMSWVSDSLAELEYKDSEIERLKEEVERLKTDIDGENTELANRAVKKLLSAMKTAIDEVSDPYWLGRSEMEWKDLREENAALCEKVENIVEWVKYNAYNRCLNCGSREGDTDWDELKQILGGTESTSKTIK